MVVVQILKWRRRERRRRKAKRESVESVANKNGARVLGICGPSFVAIQGILIVIFLVLLVIISVRSSLSASIRRVHLWREVVVPCYWHAGLVPVLLAAKYRPYGVCKDARSIVVIHNLAHQGVELAIAYNKLGVPLEWYGALEWVFPTCASTHALDTSEAVNFLKQGYSWEITTPEGGYGPRELFDQFEQLSGYVGITNGIDVNEWDPSSNQHIPSHYSIKDLSGMVECKIALQKELGLPITPDCPLIRFIGRLDYQKGTDVILSAIPELLQDDVQFLQFVLRFESCDLNQLYAMRYGTVPVVHGTRGLRDTVETFNPYANEGSGGGTGNSSISVLHIVPRKEVGTVYEKGKRFNLMTLLASLPRLGTLCLDGYSLKVSVGVNEAIGVVNYMEAEVLLTKLLLSHSPSFERMVIENRSGIDAKEGLRISTELMQFPQASTKAQIMYLP
ncbi:hypothetical protein LguiA_021880 [Lonicera macranthoides]